MEFVKEFATFLYQNDAIKFGNFKLSSGKDSPYYIDLRLVPSFPHQFRKMIKTLQNTISEKIGFENFDCIASVPTSGLVIASALAIEIVKPLIYIRQKPKEYGTENVIEGKIAKGTTVLLVDDVATTGLSLINAIRPLKNAGLVVTDAFTIINRFEGAREALATENVRLYEITDIMTLATLLHKENLVDDQTLERVKKQIGLI
ncbi:MAG TPA: orotate phosphoribosyltransferase [Nitrosopumilaceae archaeon]|nr:orotate phosphoribosyltransferase [Nitrosopumilaceae archaeon]HXV38539.1 orotate phosphoribosyltransferase [Nitrosopumilaceae archaeon]